MVVGWKGLAAALAVYGTAHALVDATSVATIFSAGILHKVPASTLFAFVLLYNFLAFGLQVPIGLAVDRLRNPAKAALAGCLIAAAAPVAGLLSPLLAVCVAGIGNAIFHVGGGAVSINLTKGKATAPGIFVAPGAIGLLAGTILGKSWQPAPWALGAALAVASLIICLFKIPEETHGPIIAKPLNFDVAMALLILAIGIRAFVGSAVPLPWKSRTDLLLALTVSVAFGKAFGGILADRFGWIRVSVGSLLLSAPLLAFFPGNPVAGICGMFLFNITMAIALTAVANLMPANPGFSLGLNCLALLAGSLPSFAGLPAGAGGWPVVACAVLAACAAMFLGLRLSGKEFIRKSGAKTA